MKRTIIYRRLLLVAAIPALMLAGCTKDDAPGDGGDDKSRTTVRFIAGIIPGLTRDLPNRSTPPVTRAAPGGDETQTVWQKGDQIGVFMLPHGGKIPADTLPGAHNVPYEADPATGELTQLPTSVYDPATGGFKPGILTPMYYPMTYDEVDFVAYSPYEMALESIPPYNIYVAGRVDQTTAENQSQADILYSDNARNIHRSKDAVTLQFRHLMAKLRLDITLGEGFTGGEVTKVTLPGMPWQVHFDMRDGSVNKINPPSDASTISCLRLPSTADGTGTTATFTALVPPHSGADFAGRQITVTVNGEDYTGSLPDADVYRGNTMYAYPVRVTHHGVTIGAPTADVPWTDTKALPKGYDLTVGNETELRAFAKAVNSRLQINGKPAAEAKVLQTADITLTQGEWTPIGNGDNLFRGAYNGDGHTITGLSITTTPPADSNNEVNVGLFGCAEGAVLTGIHLREVEINIQAINRVCVGSIAGSFKHTTLSLCSATGKVEAGGTTRFVYAGGIAGNTVYSTISRCRAGVETKAANMAAEEVCAGGVVGCNDGFILSCETYGSPVTADRGYSSYAGGIAGMNHALIAFCRTGTNTVTAQNASYLDYAGGLVGSNNGYLYSCYSRATAVGLYAGAIVGTNIVSDRVQHCYGTGANGPGNSGLAADPALGIYYETSPGSDVIFGVMEGYKGIVESIIGGGTFYPYATRYDRAVYPAHGITPVRVKWGPGERVWQRGINTAYPEINMEYGGEDAAAAP